MSRITFTPAPKSPYRAPTAAGGQVYVHSDGAAVVFVGDRSFSGVGLSGEALFDGEVLWPKARVTGQVPTVGSVGRRARRAVRRTDSAGRTMTDTVSAWRPYARW